MNTVNNGYAGTAPESESSSSLEISSIPEQGDPGQRQQLMAAEFEVTVKDWWIQGGRLVVPKEYRQCFPPAGEPIVLIDYEGRMYRSKMHNLWQGVDVGRIDGIKPFYKNHPIIVPETKLRIKATGKNTAIVMMGDRPSRQISQSIRQ